MIIIADVHGRDFWKAPVYEYQGKEHIIFLGDYLDPYDYESIPQEVVFVTHHVPSRLLVAPEFSGSSHDSGFTVDLTDYIKNSDIDLWVYGHSHRSIEKVIGKTRVVSNQLGYVAYGEYKKNFSGDKYYDWDESGDQ